MNHSVMIADDEDEIRQAMIELIAWEKLGFEFVGEAANGNDALEIIEREPPDVLITDIKMPYLSGIELAKKVREISPVTKIIFLTGFEEFEYAKSAIKLNVVEYLLKPVSLEELNKTLMELKTLLVKEKAQATNFLHLEKSYREEFEVLKNTFLISLLVAEDKIDLTESEIEKQVKHYQLKLIGDTQLVLVIQFNQHYFQQHVSEQEIALSEFSLRKQTRQIIRKYVQGEVFSFSRYVVAILSDEEGQLELFQHIIVKEVQESARQLFNLPLKMGLSQGFKKLSDIKSAFEEALSALRLPKVVSLFTHEFSPLKDDSYRYPLDSHVEKKIQFLVLAQEREQLIAVLERLLQKAYTQGNRVFLLVINHLEVILQRLAMSVGNVNEEEVPANSYNRIPAKEANPVVLNEQMIADYLLLQEVLSDYQQTAAAAVGQQAYTYLLENYQASNLSLTRVAKHFAISPSYFSTIFKQTNGQSFTAALTQIRMLKAQELLLATTDRIMEIANQVGFIDQHYFSYAYKKYFGSSPKATRMKLKDTNIPEG